VIEMKAHVSEKKKEVVAEFAELIDKYPVIGVVNMANLPTKQLQNMRSTLRDGKTVLRMTKKRLMKIAFEKAKKDVKGLTEYFEGMPALIFTEENPFKLYSTLQKSKSTAPAKAGQKAPRDIKVSAGPTSFAPGPIIGQLGKYKIKAGVEGGKIAIKEDAVVAKKGDVIDADLAGILSRLGIEPMEIGLNLTAVFENGSYFTSDVLHIDESEYAAKFATAYSDSFNLAVYAAYPTADTAKVLVNKAYAAAIALALSQNILTDETAKHIIAKAHGEMLALSSSLPDNALSEELRSSMVASVAPTTAPAEESKSSEAPKKEEPEEKNENAAAGLGALFG